MRPKRRKGWYPKQLWVLKNDDYIHIYFKIPDWSYKYHNWLTPNKGINMDYQDWLYLSGIRLKKNGLYHGIVSDTPKSFKIAVLNYIPNKSKL